MLNSRRLLALVMVALLLVGAVQVALMGKRDAVAFDRYGAGAPVTIAIHGSPGSRKDFVKLAPQLDGTVYALDMPGFGESQRFVGDYGADAGAQVVLDFMDAQGIERATVLGYSWGGAVAVEVATVAPQRVERVVLLASMGLTEAEPLPIYALERMRYFVSAPVLLVYPGTLLMDFSARHGFLRSYIDTHLPDIERHLSELQVPTRIVHGRNDTVVPTWAAERYAQIIPDSELRWFEGGHGTIFYDGKVIAEAMR